MADIFPYIEFREDRNKEAEWVPKESSNFEFLNEFEWIYRMNESFGMKNFMIYLSIDIQRLIFDYQNDCQCDK